MIDVCIIDSLFSQIPVFTACGVTPQNVILTSKPSLAITHSPGCMYVTDLTNESLSVG